MGSSFGGRYDNASMVFVGNKGHCCVLPSEENDAFFQRRFGQKANKKALSMARSRWVDREVLGVLQQDKDYLTKFLKRPGMRKKTTY